MLARYIHGEGYIGSEGMVAWLFHRLAGIALFAFIVLHVFDIYLAGADPQAYDDLLAIYASTAGRIAEVLLGGVLLYHSLNGVRILIMDFWPRMTAYHKQMWYANWVIFFGLGLPGAFIIMRPALGL